jgi:hypothetical protein
MPTGFNSCKYFNALALHPGPHTPKQPHAHPWCLRSHGARARGRKKPVLSAEFAANGWSQPFGLLWGLQGNPYGPCILGWSQPFGLLWGLQGNPCGPCIRGGKFRYFQEVRDAWAVNFKNENFGENTPKDTGFML